MLVAIIIIVVSGILMLGATPSEKKGDSSQPERTAHSTIANKELKARVSVLVKDVRAMIYAQKSKDVQLLAGFDKSSRPETPANERKRLKEQWVRETDNTHDQFMRDYKEKYWADAIVFRNELQRRLPKNLRQPQLSGIYQYPTNILGVEVIADNLELLAKSLPDE
jgi:hypothetical protein